MKYKHIVVLDTETTDKYWNSAAPIQIAAVICDSDGNILDSFNERIKTTHRISPDASAVHHIYVSDLVNCRSEREVLMDFVLWLKGYNPEVVLTYNGEAFDRPMLNLRCQKCKIDTDYFDKGKFPGIDGYYDCVALAKKQNLFGLKDLGRRWKLTLVAEKLGVLEENAHDALADVKMLKNVFFKLDPLVHPEKWKDNFAETEVSLF